MCIRDREREEIKVAIYSEELQKPKITKEHIAFWISKFRDTDLTDVACRKRLVDVYKRQECQRAHYSR